MLDRRRVAGSLPRRCPFLALSLHQKVAIRSKARHKAKLENRSILAVTLPDPAAPSTERQSPANDAFSVC
jgi:hypothetical protein